MMAQKPDLALVDLDGAATEALAFVAEIRKHDAEIPVLMICRPGDRALAASCSAQGIVPKPISGHELSIRVGSLVCAPRPKPAAPAALELPKRGTISGGTLGEALPPAQPQSSGSLIDDLPPVDKVPPHPETPREDESAQQRLDLARRAPAKYRPVEDEETLSARKARTDASAQWQEALEANGHRRKRGEDAPSLDLTACLEAHLSWLETQGAAGARAVLNRLDLAGSDFSHTILAAASFRDSDLSDSSFAEARLDGGDFRHAVLNAANLAGANMVVAQMRHVDLRLANLEGVVLRGADLSGARFGGARLEGTDLNGAILIGADLCDADLSKTEGLIQTQLEKTRCNGATRLPLGLTRPSAPAD